MKEQEIVYTGNTLNDATLQRKSIVNIGGTGPSLTIVKMNSKKSCLNHDVSSSVSELFEQQFDWQCRSS